MVVGDAVIVQFADGFEPVKGYWLDQSSASVTIRTLRGGTMNGPYDWVKKI